MFSMMPYYTARPVKARSAERYVSPFSEEFFRSFFGETSQSMLKVDVEDKGDHYLLETDLPGVKRDEVRLSVEDGVLTIAIEQNEEKSEGEEKNRSYVYHERRSMSASRSFSLEGVEEDQISAEYVDGVLHLTLPKKAEEPVQGARRIEIR